MKRKILTIDKDEKGSALVLVLAVLMTLTLLGFGVITTTSTNMSLSRNYETATQALNMAEIGAKVAYREFINTGFLKKTHVVGNKSDDFKHFKESAEVVTGDDLIETTLEHYSIDEYGSRKDGGYRQ